MVLGLQNAFWSTKRVLEQLYHLWTQKVRAWQGLRRGESGAGKFRELLAPKVHLGAPWDPLGPEPPGQPAVALASGHSTGAGQGWG